MEKLFHTASEVCAKLGMDSRQFREYLEKGIFPRGIKRGKRKRVWSVEDLQAMIWIEKNKHRLRREIEIKLPPKT